MPQFSVFTSIQAAGDTARGRITPNGAGTFYGQAVGGSGAGQSIHLRWTGTPTGTFTLWYTNKKDPDFTTDTDWTQDTSSTLANPAGAAGSTFMDTFNSNARLRRVKYVNTSGAGVIEGEFDTRGY